MPITILGISAYYHDSAAALIRDDEIIAAAQEERFSRIRHDHEFPKQAIDYCLSAGAGAKAEGLNASATDVDYVVFYDKPFLKFERILETYLSYAPRGYRSFLKAIPLWLKKKIWIKLLIEESLPGFKGEILFTEHHQSHAASAFFPSPFEQAAIITADGVGEWATTSIAVGQDKRIDLLKEIHFPHSLGLLYSAFTYYTGFKVNSGEYKVMGLAPYGDPVYVQTILEHLIDVKDDGSFQLNMAYFNYPAGLTMTNHKFNRLFGGLPRQAESALTRKDMDLARSVQEVVELVMLKMARQAREVSGSSNLCLAGGVALNCVANGKILREEIFDNIWIQPAAGDAGGALGAALAVWYQYLGKARIGKIKDERLKIKETTDLGRSETLPRPNLKIKDSQKGSYLGPQYSDEQIRAFLDEQNIPYLELGTGNSEFGTNPGSTNQNQKGNNAHPASSIENRASSIEYRASSIENRVSSIENRASTSDSTTDDLYTTVAKLLAEEQVIGWFQGRMEFGPRALGARSILGDARSPEMQKKMNLKIKYRESFRPFAPAVLAEEAVAWFEIERESPYMLLTATVREEKRNVAAPGDAPSRGALSVARVEEEQALQGIEKLQVVRSQIPAVTHVDYSARLQTVHKETNPFFWQLLNAFKALTGCPVLVNTSFNVRGEPIVCTPQDAYRCFIRTEMDYLVLGRFLLDKKQQPPSREKDNWQMKFELD